MSIVLYIGFSIPITIRKKDVCIVFISIEFEKLTTFKCSYMMFVGFKIIKKKDRLYVGFNNYIKLGLFLTKKGLQMEAFLFIDITTKC